MPARQDWTPAELAERLDARRRQNREAQQRFRARHKHHADGVSTTDKPDAPPENGVLPSIVSITPSLPPDPPLSPALSTKGPPLDDRLTSTARLQDIRPVRRGYKHDQGLRRLEKLIRDFPHLDVEEVVDDGLDWLDRPENKKRVNSLGFHRHGCRAGRGQTAG